MKVYIQNISVNILIGFSGAEKRRFSFSISVPVEFYPRLEISVLVSKKECGRLGKTVAHQVFWGEDGDVFLIFDSCSY